MESLTLKVKVLSKVYSNKKGKGYQMILGIILIASFVLFFVAYKIQRNKSFEAKWRKIKFETIMGLNGFVGGTRDLFYRSADKVGEKLEKAWYEKLLTSSF